MKNIWGFHKEHTILSLYMMQTAWLISHFHISVLFQPSKDFIIRGSLCHCECLYGDKMHGLSLTATVMTMECRIVIVLLSLLKTVDVDLKCIVVGDETEGKK